jgi:hypothetical protein
MHTRQDEGRIALLLWMVPKYTDCGLPLFASTIATPVLRKEASMASTRIDASLKSRSACSTPKASRRYFASPLFREVERMKVRGFSGGDVTTGRTLTLPSPLQRERRKTNLLHVQHGIDKFENNGFTRAVKQWRR